MNPNKRESFGYFDILYIRTFRNITILKRGIEVAENDNKSERKDKKDEETTFTLILGNTYLQLLSELNLR